MFQNSVFQAKLLVIGDEIFWAHNLPHSEFLIYTLSGLEALKKVWLIKLSYNMNIQILTELRQETFVYLGHAYVHGNEVADLLTKEATNTINISADFFSPFPPF